MWCHRLDNKVRKWWWICAYYHTGIVHTLTIFFSYKCFFLQFVFSLTEIYVLKIIINFFLELSFICSLFFFPSDFKNLPPCGTSDNNSPCFILETRKEKDDLNLVWPAKPPPSEYLKYTRWCRFHLFFYVKLFHNKDRII